MFDKLSLTGILGIVFMLAGIVVLGLVDPLVAAGVALVIAGLGFVAHGLITSMLAAFGMA